jgi:hypothetical protein
MTPLQAWQVRWGHLLPPEAVRDLRAALDPVTPPPGPVSTTSEQAAASYIRIHAGQRGIPLWRNNNGAAYDQTGRLIRFGLGHESAALQARWKSSDLIGILPVTIEPAHVGCTLGVFLAVETKAPGWYLTPGDKRGQAQAAFLQSVRGFGGAAGFASGVQDLEAICDAAATPA